MNPKVQYSHEVAPAKETCSPTWRSCDCPEGKNRSYYYDDAKTLHECFMRGRRISGDKPCYGYRPIDAEGKAGDYVWFTYNEVWERVQDFASGLIYLDLVPVKFDLRCIGVFSRNRVEWCILEQACNAYGFTIVPTYETLGADAMLYILRETEMKTIVCSSVETVKILSMAEKGIPLEVVIQMEDATETDKKLASDAHIKLYSMSEVEKLGHEHRVECTPPKPEDVCTICYTSGTTGIPKGVIITNQNIIASVAGCLDTGLYVTSESRYLSYLPLAHVLERLLHLPLLQEGGRIGFYQGSTLTILDDMKTLRPTVFTSVPRLLNKIHQKVMEKINKTGGLTKFLFDRGIQAKKAGLARGYNTHWFYDTFVFSKVKQSIGLDDIQLTISGSAPLSAEVLTFLRCVLGNRVVEGYGATETSAATILQEYYDFTSGHVGGPMTCCDMRLEDVPDMHYLHTDTEHNGEPCIGRGELCLRVGDGVWNKEQGYNVSSGYFRHPELTKEAFDADGFFHTGDIVMVYPNGATKIIDRKKNFFKLSQGEYVAAEKLEIIYGQCPMVSQIFVYGDSARSFLVAIVVADESGVMTWAKEHGLAEKSFEELCDSEELKKGMKEEFARLMKENGLKGFERIVDFKIEKEQWTTENGLLTPTFKLKRTVVQKEFQKELDSLYAANPEH